MFKTLLTAAVLISLPCLALADQPREVGQGELRRMVASGQSLQMSRMAEIVVGQTGGTPVDIRLFDTDGLYYLVIAQKPSGQMIRLVMNARSGDILANASPIVARVYAAASDKKAAAVSARSAAQTKAKGNQGKAGAGSKEDNGTAGGAGNSGGNGNAGGNGKGGGNGKK